jgi:hypothetical protein
MISKDKTYRTQDGREVRIYATDGGWNGSIHGAVNLGSLCKPSWMAMQWTESGMCMGVMNSGHDLVEVKPRHKRTVWLNVHVNRSVIAHNFREEADNLFSKDVAARIACIKT